MYFWLMTLLCPQKPQLNTEFFKQLFDTMISSRTLRLSQRWNKIRRPSLSKTKAGPFKTKLRPSGVVLNPVSALKPVSTTTTVTCAFHWLGIERGRGWRSFPGSFYGLHLWLISNNKPNAHLVTCHRMISPNQPWFRVYPQPPPKLHICSNTENMN